MFGQVLEWASVFQGAPCLGNMKGNSFLRAFEIKRYIKMPCKHVSLSMLGNLEGIRLPGLSERKGKYTWFPFLDPDNIKILSLEAI
jgi:hypothetical protein